MRRDAGVRSASRCRDGGGGEGSVGAAAAESSPRVEVDASLRRHDNGDRVAAGDGDAVDVAPLNDRDLLRNIRCPTFLAYANDERLPSAPSYASAFSIDAGLPRAQPSRSGPIPPGARFATSVVETVDTTRLREFMPDGDWNVVQVLTDTAAFERLVLAADWRQRLRDIGPQQPCRLSRDLVEDLIAKGYLRPVPPGTKPPITCVVFAVLKSDGVSLRLIWNGIRFNLICNPPPLFTITRLPDMLGRLLRPGVKYYITWDFSTWFVELRAPAAARFFMTEIAGEVYEVAGVPMGAAWACAIAQACTAAVSRALLAELKATPDDLVFEHCIDNTCAAVLTDALTPQQILQALQTVCNRFGVHVKPSSVEHGHTIDWLLYSLRLSPDGSPGTAELKADYRGRLRKAATRVRHYSARHLPSYTEVWSICGLMLFTLYATRTPYTRAPRTLHWLATSLPQSARAWMGPATFPHWREVRELLEHFGGLTVRPPLLPGGRYRAWAITDAALSAGARGLNAVIAFTPRHTVLSVYQCISSHHIAERELCASVTALRLLAAPEAGTGGAVVSFTDNETARAAVDRGYSVVAPPVLAQALERQTIALEAVCSYSIILRVDTHRCVADAWTRHGVTKSVTWPRTCSHPFVPTYICPCTERALLGTGAPPDPLHAWQRNPPAVPALRDPSSDWFREGVVRGTRPPR